MKFINMILFASKKKCKNTVSVMWIFSFRHVGNLGQLLKDQTGKKKEIQDMENMISMTISEHAIDSFLLSNNSFCMHGNFQR